MTNYFRRARSVLRDFLFAGERRDVPAGPEPRPAELVAPVSVGNNLVLDGSGIAFAGSAQAAANAAAWLDMFEAALVHGAPISEAAIQLLRSRTAGQPPDRLLPGEARSRLLELLRPRPGLASRLRELGRAGVLTALFPEVASPSRH